MATYNPNYELFIGSPIQDGAFVANTASIPSGQLKFTALQGTRLGVPQRVLPQVKLYDAGGNQIDPATKISIYHSIPGLDPQYLGSFYYRNFYDIAIADQGDVTKQGGLWKTLTRSATVEGGESLVFQFDGPTVIDVSNTGNVLSMRVIEGIGA